MWQLITLCWAQEAGSRPLASYIAAQLCPNSSGSGSVSSDEHPSSSGNLHPGNRAPQPSLSSAYAYETDDLTMKPESQAGTPRAVPNADDALPAPRDSAHVYDDLAAEKIRLMQDTTHLEAEVIEGLIHGLNIPAPNTTNPAAVKEILFPANLISMITNEMWKYGLIRESECFFAHVMQTIQGHVMVRIQRSLVLWC